MKKSILLGNNSGFTLIEIIAVLVLLGILAAVAVPKYMNMQTQAQGKAVEGALAAAASNSTMAYSKFLLVNSSMPNAIAANAWSDGTNTQAIDTNLGDFTSSYAFDNATGTITVTITAGPVWFAGAAVSKTKSFQIQ